MRNLNILCRKWGVGLRSINAIISKRKDKKLEELININAKAYSKIGAVNIIDKHTVAVNTVVEALLLISKNTRFESEVGDILDTCEKYLYTDRDGKKLKYEE